jgi:hypothetical protein
LSYTYSTFQSALAAAIEDSQFSVADADFVALLPTIIDMAEQRVYRDLDLLTAVVTVSGALTANSRTFTIPTSSGGNAIHVLEARQLNILDVNSNRWVARPVSREAIDLFWPSDTASSSSSIPSQFARISDTQLLVGQSPGSNWVVELIATVRPAPLSITNASTYLSNYLSDLFFASAMVAATGTILKNFGSQADNPAQANSWESTYQKLLASAKAEEARKKFATVISGAPA